MMIITLLLSILGFLNAFYLYYQHKREVESGQKMYCLIGGDCGTVVGSKYGRTLGIKNEKIGMVYYGFIALYLLINSFISQDMFAFALLIEAIAFVATIFSLYLLYVQTIILKKFCSWCLIAIGINILIFYFLTFSPNSLYN